MNQSFNVENFVKIYYDENRKGHYIEGQFPIFAEVKDKSDQIVELNKEFRTKTKEYRQKYISKETYESFKAIKNPHKEHLIEEKHKALEIALKTVEEKISNNDFSLELDDTLPPIGGKTIYTINRLVPEPFFVLKQLQKNIQYSFKVKQADRYEILSQVKNLLDNSFPKYVIRTDIKSFFESIPHDKLKEKIAKNHILSPFSKKIIYQILCEYARLTGVSKGIPRGIGISAYLSELYMRDIDNAIKSLKNVTYYARYVDDIILIITPNTKHESVRHLTKLKWLIRKWGLKTHPTKTKEYDLSSQPNRTEYLDFLGYNIQFSNQDKPVKIKFTNSKLDRIKRKIDLAIDAYNTNSKYNEAEARKLFIKRLQFLTGNTRLLNVKKNILVGIYFSNTFLTEKATLTCLDQYLYAKIDNNLLPYSALCHIDVDRLRVRLKKFSFYKGLEYKIFTQFTSKELTQIMSIWKTL